MTNFWVKSAIFLNVLAKKIPLPVKNKIIHNVMIFVVTKWKDKSIFPPPLLVLLLDPVLGIRDPGSEMDNNQDPGSGINIPDPQHSYTVYLNTLSPAPQLPQLTHLKSQRMIIKKAVAVD
jgi:hypothetical protein